MVRNKNDIIGIADKMIGKPSAATMSLANFTLDSKFNPGNEPGVIILL